jgi:uncharacterized secreted protein with C-terminal beta-propeller domain
MRSSPSSLLAAWLGLTLALTGACSNSDDHDHQGSPGAGGMPGAAGGGGSEDGGERVPVTPHGDPSPYTPEGRADASVPGSVDASVKPKPPEGQPQSFESDVPTAGGGVTGGLLGGVAGGAGGFVGGGAPTNGQTPPATADASRSAAERAIVEADIVQLVGTRLYALSRSAGLSVIDIADPRNLQLLGTYRKLNGTPFEMYLRESVVVVMYNGWGQYTKQADGKYTWVQTSKVVALDAANPAAIANLGNFDLAGEISDSRLVGDVLYVVAFENGSCWNCDKSAPQTGVLSLNVADPRAIKRIDELKFPSMMDQWGGRRSIAVNTQRIYIGGPEYGPNPTNSTIQVVDIADPNGDLVAGTQVKVGGQITNRWQMDEFEGVLRVISQPWQWARGTTGGTVPPAVETFTVVSSQQLTKLGHLDMRIPANETLQSVRFDGKRGYAITAVRTDPLFTIDLSNPAQPRQLGELEMPGFIYHMEPRGDRVIGLGYDQGNPQGAITVSIFDVSNLAQPRMLSRVNFGGDWAHLPEDQDRIHKAFKVLDQQNLIVVPFSGWSNWTNRSYCSTQYRSGVQLVDFANDALTARGVAPSRGEARRALVQGNTLLTVSDEAVDAFDVSNRATPSALGQLTLARNVTHALPLANDHVARINQDWYAQNSSIDIVRLADAENASVSTAQLDLSTALRQGTDACSYNAWVQSAYVAGNQVNVLFNRYTYDAAGGYRNVTGLLVVDVSNPSAPSLASTLTWIQAESGPNYYREAWQPFYGYYSYGYTGAQANIVRTEAALVMLEQRYRESTTDGYSYDVRARVVDLRDAKAPSVTTLMLPTAQSYAGLVPDGANVLFSHYERSPGASSARFYVDRIDLSDPKQPKLTDKISVPGALLHYDRQNSRAVTSELMRTSVQGLTADECFKRFSYASYGSSLINGTYFDGICTGFLQRLRLVGFVPGGAVLEDTYQLSERERLTSTSLGDARVVGIIGQNTGGWIGGGIADCFNCGWGGGYYFGTTSEPAEAFVLGGLEVGKFEVGRLKIGDSVEPWWGFYGSPRVYANGKRALVNSQNDAVVLDTSVASAPKLLRSVPLYGYVQRFDTKGNLALLALGMNGVQRIDL